MSKNYNYPRHENKAYYHAVCEQLRQGAPMDDPDSQEIMRDMFQSITRYNDTDSLKGLFQAGLLLEYTMPEYVMKNVGAFAFVNLALGCLQFLEQIGFDFTTNEFMVDKKNYFLYAVSRSEPQIFDFIVGHTLKKDNQVQERIFNAQDAYGKNALHLAVEQYSEEILNMILALPLDYSTYCQKDDNGESAFLIAIILNKDNFAQKILDKFSSQEWFDTLRQDLELLQTENYSMLEEHAKWSQAIQSKEEKLLLETQILTPHLPTITPLSQESQTKNSTNNSIMAAPYNHRHNTPKIRKI